MDGATQNGHLDVVKWLHRVHHECCSSEAMSLAIRYEGHLDMLKWLHAHLPKAFSCIMMDTAAKNGHLDVVTWLHRHRREGCSESAPRQAAQNGHFEV
ncbi:hypothetical protein PHYSODRAFT_404881, partial [Phytophthora sojae]